MRAKFVNENINNLFKPKDFMEIIKSKIPSYEKDLTLNSYITVAAPFYSDYSFSKNGWYFNDFAKQKYNVNIDLHVDKRKSIGITGKVKNIINLFKEWDNMSYDEAIYYFIHILKYDMG